MERVRTVWVLFSSSFIIYLSVGGLIIRWNKVTRPTTHQIVNIIFSILVYVCGCSIGVHPHAEGATSHGVGGRFDVWRAAMPLTV
jgi:hypothetical protein